MEPCVVQSANCRVQHKVTGCGFFSELLLLQTTSCRAEHICSQPKALRKERIACCVWVASIYCSVLNPSRLC